MGWLKIWRWKIHWQILLAMGLGIAVGMALQGLDPRPRLAGIERDAAEPAGTRRSRVEVEPAERIAVDRSAPRAQVDAGDAEGPLALRAGDRVVRVGGREVASAEAFLRLLSRWPDGARVSLSVERDGVEVPARGQVVWAASSPRARALLPLSFLADAFRRLLQMLIVPLILTSLVTGVASLGNLRSLGRIGVKTLSYYVATSLLAILVGLVLVQVIQPGWEAKLDLAERVEREDLAPDEGFLGIFLRMIPQNVFAAFGENAQILQVIFFSLLLGAFITRVGGSSGDLLRRLFEAGFQVMMKVAEFVLLFIPVGVFALIARVVGSSGFEPFIPLLKLMLTVVLALLIHACATLPLMLLLLARVRPLRWARCVMPALVTAFSTASSAVTLPETMRSVEERGGVSNRTGAFVLPLGATINMDGTALYECVGVIFLAQYYASAGDFELTLGGQLVVVITALLASIGAAGIPAAGLVMMTTILSALRLPLDGVVLLLAVDRPLDMLRTAVNVWSDTTCAAIVARSEGEADIAAPQAVQ